jgi:[ribosomal protein S18]-alanine N-acetyltransferase
VSGVRRATPADLPALMAIDAACFARPWTAAGWAPELAGAGATWILGEPALGLIGPRRAAGLIGPRRALGFACAPVLLDVCELRRIAIVPTAQRRGLGRDLLAAVIAHARQAGAACVELEVSADNLGALGLYRSLGFLEVGRRPNYYVEPPADAVLLTLALRPDAAAAEPGPRGSDSP